MIEVLGNDIYYVTSGVIETNSENSIPLRLKTILSGINEIIAQHSPSIASIEQIFFNVNPKSSLLLGQARAAAICSCVERNIEVFEYTALQVKQAITGFGHADKTQITKMVRYILKLDGNPQVDAADALANAITHHYCSKSFAKLHVKSKHKERVL